VEAKKDLLEYLETKYGNKFITPKQLSQEIPVSPKQQSLLRKKEQFPIKHKNIGKNVFYSIYSVASFLLDDEVQEVEKTKSKPVVAEVRKQTPKTEANIEDLSHIFNMKGFVAKLEQQRDTIENLIHFFNSKIAHDELQLDLSSKGSDKNRPKGKV